MNPDQTANEPRAEPLSKNHAPPINAQNASALGKVGGRSRSDRKTAAARTNALKNGTRIRPDSPNIKTLGLDNTKTRIAAPEVVERIRWLKEHYPAFYANNPEESAAGIQKFFEDSLMEILKLKSEGKNINEQMRNLGKDFISLHELRFGKLNLNKNLNINLDAERADFDVYRESVITVLKKYPGALMALGEEYERRKGLK